jgi:hypothetical protein
MIVFPGLIEEEALGVMFLLYARRDNYKCLNGEQLTGY